ncbi:hypothetical protein ABPG72_020035 [Tetrahymena utriculariae]
MLKILEEKDKIKSGSSTRINQAQDILNQALNSRPCSKFTQILTQNPQGTSNSKQILKFFRRTSTKTNGSQDRQDPEIRETQSEIKWHCTRAMSQLIIPNQDYLHSELALQEGRSFIFKKAWGYENPLPEATLEASKHLLKGIMRRVGVSLKKKMPPKLNKAEQKVQLLNFKYARGVNLLRMGFTQKMAAALSGLTQGQIQNVAAKLRRDIPIVKQSSGCESRVDIRTVEWLYQALDNNEFENCTAEDIRLRASQQQRGNQRFVKYSRFCRILREKLHWRYGEPALMKARTNDEDVIQERKSYAMTLIPQDEDSLLRALKIASSKITGESSRKSLTIPIFSCSQRLTYSPFKISPTHIPIIFYFQKIDFLPPGSLLPEAGYYNQNGGIAIQRHNLPGVKYLYHVMVQAESVQKLGYQFVKIKIQGDSYSVLNIYSTSKKQNLASAELQTVHKIEGCFFDQFLKNSPFLDNCQNSSTHFEELEEAFQNYPQKF